MRMDFDILEDVVTQLQWQPALHANKITVEVEKGIVTLSGHVNTYAKKMAAEKAVRNIAGVKAIVENIQVGKLAADKTDKELAELILQELAYHTAIKEEKVILKVDHGIVTLEGKVDWAYQRFAIRREIERIPGVRHVNNYIMVESKSRYTV
jgi:osmotically-inducible protein OsmY